MSYMSCLLVKRLRGSVMVCFIFFACFGFVAPAIAENGKPASVNILVSVRPVALLVEDLLERAGLGDKIAVDVLLPAGASPHHLSLKVSDIRRVQQADLLVWVGEPLENYLTPVIALHRATKPTIELITLNKLHRTEAGHRHGHNHNEGSGGDPHIWLDPDNAAIIARAVAVQLKTLIARDVSVDFDVASADQERAALDSAVVDYVQSLAVAREAVRVRLAQVANEKNAVAVYHDSLGHYVHQFDIRQQAALTEVPDEQVGMRSLIQYQKQGKPSCLLADRGELVAAEGYAKKLGWRLVTFDLLAQDTEVNTYLKYIDSITDAFETCLGFE